MTVAVSKAPTDEDGLIDDGAGGWADGGAGAVGGLLGRSRWLRRLGHLSS